MHLIAHLQLINKKISNVLNYSEHLFYGNI